MVVSGSTLLEIRNLRTTFKTEDGVASAVDGVSLHVNRGETLAIVGESGCGKSVTLLSVLRLILTPPGRIEAGEIMFGGRNLLALSEREMRRIRGNEIAMVFQEPMTSLDPVFTIGSQIAEAITLHQGVSRRAALQKAIDMLRLVGIPDPERRIQDYPYQMSGGMRQRVMIAMALSCHPKLLLADEPTTALDVTIQAQILDLMRRLKKEMDMSIVLVTHDLGVVSEMAGRMAVMYAGKVVEQGDVLSVFKRPQHPYTEGLLKSIPRVDEDLDRLRVIDGSVPDPTSFPQGCRFHPRCAHATPRCKMESPDLEPIEDGHSVACHLAGSHVPGG